jgi:hypothetical protein
MVASTAQAQVSVNNSENRKILIKPGVGNRVMTWQMTDGFPEQSGFIEPPAYSLTVSGAGLCPGPVSFFDDFWADLDLQSGLVHVLYLTVGDTTRRILSFVPHCSRWSAGRPMFGEWSSKGYLMDGLDWDRSFWRDQVMNDEVTIEVIAENTEENFAYTLFLGVIPRVQQ